MNKIERNAMDAALELASHGLHVYETTDLAGLVDWMPTTADVPETKGKKT